MALLCAHQAQELLGQEPVVESLITQEAVKARQRTTELDIGEAGELAGDGETTGLSRLAQSGDDGRARLLL